MEQLDATTLAGMIHGLGTALLDAEASSLDVQLCYDVAAKLETQGAEITALRARLAAAEARVAELEGEEAALKVAVRNLDNVNKMLEAKLRKIETLRNETRDAQRLLAPQLDPSGDARLAYGIIADRLDAALRGEEVQGE